MKNYLYQIKKRLKKQFYEKLNGFTYNYDLKARSEFVNKRGSEHGYAELTDEEKQEIKRVWGEYGGKYHAFGFYKQFCGVFNPYFVPDDYYDFAEKVLNLRWASYFLQHKCNLKYIIPARNRAKVIVQKIDGHYVLEDNTEISKEAVVSRLKEYPCFMCKIARGTGGGKGVKRIFREDIRDDAGFYDELLQGNDIEFEEIVQQHEFLSQFNPDSVNTFRFLTLNINQKCTLLSTFLRMGSKGSYVDNLTGGAGVLVGINKNGELNAFGIDKHFEKKYVSPTGVKFDGIKVPNFDDVSQQIIEFHKKIPYANLIGWDVTIDYEGNPIIIEVNLDKAIIEAHQVFNGPVFGDRLSEVKDYIENKKPTLGYQMIFF